MKIFITKVLIFLFLSLGVFALARISMYYVHIKRNNTINFNSAFVDKLKILKAHKNERKIILLGGSSVGFGLSAEQIEKATGIFTVNLGHHAGFGLIDFQDYLIENISKNDIIIFSPEWHFFIRPKTCDEPTLNNMINNNIEYGKLLHKPSYVIRSLILYPSEYAKQYPPYIYNCLNKNGDINTHCGLPSLTPLSYEIPTDKFDINLFKKTFPFISKYKTIILFPPTQAQVFDKFKTQLLDIETILRENNLFLADDIEHNKYLETDFFDATYHLNCATRQRRTDSLINNIKRFIKLNTQIK